MICLKQLNMKGLYKDLEGNEVNVLQHDEANKILYIQTAEGEKKWVSDADGKWWRSLEATFEPTLVIEEPVVVQPEPEPEPQPEPVVLEVKEEPKPIEVKPVAPKQKGKKK